MKTLDKELTILRPDESVSPHFLVRKTGLPIRLVEDLLSLMVFNSVLDAKFYILCTNDDPELIHGFEFTSKKLLTEFIVSHKYECPHCGSKLNIDNIRVGFLKKPETPLKAL